jgi:hypothetical protein
LPHISKFTRVLCCAALAAACGDAPGSAGSTLEAVGTTFRESFQLQDSVVLEQPDSAPIVRVSGIDRDESGRILVGDASEGNVKLFAPDGRLLRIIGRKGHGPGEFTAPRYPRFGPGGEVYVADAQDPRVQVFDSTGTLLRATRMIDVGVIMGFHPVSADRYLLVVNRSSDQRVLMEVDSAGKMLRQFLAIADVRPTGQPEFPLWRTVRSFFLTVAGDTAYVSSTLSDSLWSVHLPSGTEARTRLAFAGYRTPTVPDQMPPGIPGLMAWNKTFHAGSTLSSQEGNLYLPYVQGVLNNGDPMLLLARMGGTWRVMSDAPPIIAAGGGMTIGMLSPGQEQVRLGLYAPRRP